VVSDRDMRTRITVAIDDELCIASGYCVSNAPDVFDQDAEGTAFVRDGVDLDSAEGVLRESAASCPVQAISVTVVRGDQP
jgi:ferredoxin